MRPTSLMLPIFAMPSTTVAKMMGASSILISLIKPSARGWSVTAMFGANRPTKRPTKMPMRTWTYSFPIHGRSIAVSSRVIFLAGPVDRLTA